jgi:hypothetical protein
MEKRYYFIYDEVAKEFESISEIKDSHFLHLKMTPNENDSTETWYSVTTLTETSARSMFTITGFLPSAKFEELMTQAKEDETIAP